MAARSKRSADERRLAILREIANEGANRNCLECHQRGPTYVDMTIASFVCTKCCGLLRGLNPPHRTKSITMTSFTDEEIDFIRNRGNEFNRYVYLGTYDERSNLEKESLREEHKIRDFLVQKYERKRWYVDPEIAQHKMQLDRRQKAAAEQGVSLTGGSVSMPSKPPATFATRSQPVTPAGGELWSPQPSHANVTFLNDFFANCKESIPPPVDPFKSSTSSISSKDVFDPFQSTTSATTNTTKKSVASSHTVSQIPATVISPPPNVQMNSPANDFADFDAAFGGTSAPMTIAPPPFGVQSQSTPTMLPLQPTDVVAPKVETKKQFPQVDRYAALAELDEMFSGLKTDGSPKLADSSNTTSTDPWGNQQANAAVPPSNPFSPTGVAPSTTTSTTNPWGSPAAPTPATTTNTTTAATTAAMTPTPVGTSTTSPNPFAMANKSWGSTSPVLQGRITPTMMGVTSGLTGMQINGRVTPQNETWPNNGSAQMTTNSVFQNAPSQNSFPVTWGAQPLLQNGFKQQQQPPSQQDNWAVFGQQSQWPNGTVMSTNNGWPTTNGLAGNNFADVWPQQMPNSASTPTITARSTSPGTNFTQNSKILPQSISMHSPFATSNGSSGISNGSSYANPFAANKAGGVSAATRICSTSNPFL